MDLLQALSERKRANNDIPDGRFGPNNKKSTFKWGIMTKKITIKLLPNSPAKATDFEEYTKGLKINAFDRVINLDASVPPAYAIADGKAAGVKIDQIAGNAAATAELTFDVDDAHDLRVEVVRNSGGKDYKIIDKVLQYQVGSGKAPSPFLYLFLPPPGDDATVAEMVENPDAVAPSDGAGWKKAAIERAAQKAIAAEVSGVEKAGARSWLVNLKVDTPDGLKLLTHIAKNIAGDLEEAPTLPADVEKLYTLPADGSAQAKNDADARQDFERALNEFQNRRRGSTDSALQALKALRYAYIFADRSAGTLKTNTDNVGWRVPLFAEPRPGKICEVALNLKKS